MPAFISKTPIISPSFHAFAFFQPYRGLQGGDVCRTGYLRSVSPVRALFSHVTPKHCGAHGRGTRPPAPPPQPRAPAQKGVGGEWGFALVSLWFRHITELIILWSFDL